MAIDAKWRSSIAVSRLVLAPILKFSAGTRRGDMLKRWPEIETCSEARGATFMTCQGWCKEHYAENHCVQ